MPIVEEKFNGHIYRYHADLDNPKFTATWGLTRDNRIVAMHVSELTLDFLQEFLEWVNDRDKPIYASTAVRSVEAYLKRIGFKEFIKE